MNSCRSGLEARLQAERSRHPSGAGRNRRPSRGIGVNRSGSCGSTLVSSPRQDSASNFRCFAVLITIMIVGTVVLFLLRSVSTWTRLKIDQRKKKLKEIFINLLLRRKIKYKNQYSSSYYIEVELSACFCLCDWFYYSLKLTVPVILFSLSLTDFNRLTISASPFRV